jgi:hypothetical protein
VSRLRDLGWQWGSTPDERKRWFPCDDVLRDHDRHDAMFRALDVEAPAPRVFRWLCQLKVAPYSYDWLDNGGRKSPRALTPGAEALAPGQRVMGIFELASFEPGVHLTLRLRKPGVFPPLAVSYVVVPIDTQRCRLVVKLVVRGRPGLWDRIGRLAFPWLDLVMMRKQLLTLKELAESPGG